MYMDNPFQVVLSGISQQSTAHFPKHGEKTRAHVHKALYATSKKYIGVIPASVFHLQCCGGLATVVIVPRQLRL